MEPTIKFDASSIRMAFEENRLKTLSSWIYPENANHKCTAKKMAEAGFYAVDPNSFPDLTKCFICMKELDGWESHDDPFDEHKKHAPTCPFVRLGKIESEMTVYEVLNLCKGTAIKQVDVEYNAEVKALQQKFEKAKKLVSVTLKKKNKK